MASSPTGSAANGLNLLGGAAGIAGSLITSQQGKQDKRISGGQEDPALAALRKRLAAQNAQTAMSVAASQQGVNPALAQRNAQQALGQQQVQTNAQLAQGNLQSTLASRAATRGQQKQQIAGTAMGIGTGLVGLGTSMGAQQAFDASGAPAEGAAGLSAPGGDQFPAIDGGNPFGASVGGAAGLSAPPQGLAASVPGGAAGLSAPPPALAASVPGAPPASPAPAMAQDTLQMPGQMQMRGGAPQVMGGGPGPLAAQAQTPQAMASPELSALSATLPTQPGAGQDFSQPVTNQAAGQLQMRGGNPQVTGQAPAPQAAVFQAMQTPQLQEASVAQPAPAAAPPQAAPAPQEMRMTSAQRIQALDPKIFEDPMNSSLAQAASNAEGRGNDQMAEIMRRAILQRVGGL